MAMPQLQVKPKQHWIKSGLLIAVLVLFWFGWKLADTQITQAASGINSQLNYQGKLNTASGAAVADGTYNIKLAIYDAASGGTCLWTAVGSCLDNNIATTTVTTVNGVFSVVLGGTGQNSLATSTIATTYKWNTDSLYLGVTIRGTTASPVYDEEMTPRKRITSSAYAFNADLVDGISATSTAAVANQLLALDSFGNLNLFNQGVSSTFATTTWLYVRSDAQIDGNATTTKSMYVGSQLNIATTSPWAGYELAVTGDEVLTGNLYTLGYGQFNNITTTDILYAGGYASSTGGLFTQGNFWTGGNATTSNRLTVGSTNPTVNASLFSTAGSNTYAGYFSGDLYVSSNATTSGNLNVSGYASTTNLVLANGASDLGTYYDLHVNSGNLFFDATQLTGANGLGFWQYGAGLEKAISPTSTDLGIFVTASSTIAANFRVDGNATTTKSMYVGSQLNVATTSPWTGYELAVTGDEVLTGNLYTLGYGQFNNVSTTDTLYIGGYASTTGGLFTQGNLWVGGDATTTSLYASSQLNVATTSPWAGYELAVTGDEVLTGEFYNLGLTKLTDLRTNNINASTTANFNNVFIYGSATTTHNYFVSGYASSTGGLFTQGNGHFGGNLTVDGNATTTGQFEADSTLYAKDGMVGVGMDPTSLTAYGIIPIFGTYHTWTGTSGTIYGNYFSSTFSPTADSAAAGYGITAITNAEGTEHQSYIFGIDNSATYKGSASLGQLTGLRSTAELNGTGSVTTTAAISATVNNGVDNGGDMTDAAGLDVTLTLGATAGTVTNWKGINIGQPAISGGTLTNNYGLYIEDQTGATQNYAIWTNDGQVRLDNSVATTTLYVTGNSYSVGNATTTKSMYIGSQLNVATTTPWTGYELAVTGDEVLTGNLYTLGYGQFNNVSTTDTLYAGGYASSTGGLFTQGNGHFGNGLTVDGNNTTTGKLIVGSFSSLAFETALFINGNSYLNGSVTTTGNLDVGNNINLGTLNIVTSTWSLVVGDNNTVGGASSHIVFGSRNQAYGNPDNSAFGHDNTSCGFSSSVFGANNYSCNNNSFVMGKYNTSTAERSLAGGNYTEIVEGADDSFIYGNHASTTGQTTVGFGSDFKITGNNVFAVSLNGGSWFNASRSNSAVFMNGQVGVATTTPWTGYELAVTGDEVLTGNLYGLGYGQFNNVSTTDTLTVGGYASSTGGLFTQGNGHFGGNLTVNGNATTTGIQTLEGNSGGNAYWKFDSLNVGGGNYLATLEGSSFGGTYPFGYIWTGIGIVEKADGSVNPRLYFDKLGSVYESYIEHNTTTDAMHFVEASDGYKFDNLIYATGTSQFNGILDYGNLKVNGNATTTGTLTVVTSDSQTATANMYIDANGLIHTATSARRFKTNINYSAVQGSWLYLMKPVTFNEISSGNPYIGLIADDMAEIDPRFASYDASGEIQGIEWNAVTSALIQTVKDQKVELDLLAAQVDNLITTTSESTSEPLTVIDNPDLNVQTLVVQQAATFYGTLYVQGEAGFMHKVVFEDDIEVKGKIYASADQAGTAVIPADATSTEIIFNTEYEAVPKIAVTLQGAKPVFYGIADKTTNGFRIVLTEPFNEELAFDWIALAVKNQGEKPVITDFITSNESAGFEQSLELWAKVTDPDTPESDLTYKWELTPNLGILSGDTGLIYWSINQAVAQDTDVTVKVTVSDGENSASTSKVIKVLAPKIAAEEPVAFGDQETIAGCTDQTALNYNPQANQDDGSCGYEEQQEPTVVLGCTDESAPNYNPQATQDDGSCQSPEPIVYGCTDQTALNYSPEANQDNGSCQYQPITQGESDGIGGVESTTE